MWRARHLDAARPAPGGQHLDQRPELGGWKWWTGEQERGRAARIDDCQFWLFACQGAIFHFFFKVELIDTARLR